MKILILGDIVGRPGRKFLNDQLAEYKKANQIDLIIANGENAAGGAGITAKTANEILSNLYIRLSYFTQNSSKNSP